MAAALGNIDGVNRPVFVCLQRATFLRASSNRPVAQLFLDDLETVADFVGIGAGAGATEEEFANVGRHGVLLLDATGAVF